MARRCLRGVALAGASIGIAAALAWLLAPKPDLYADVTFSTLIVDRRGEPLRLRTAEDGRYRLFTPLEDIASAAQEATLLYEDRGFHGHFGVDPLALLRAAWTTYIQRSRVVGGSTITMQLARLRFGLNTRSVGGKLIQIARALQIERHYDKAQILEAYLNLAPYGGAVEGIGTASRIYFDKPASALDLGQALALAVIPQNPSTRFPATDAGRAKLLAARERLFAAWQEHASAAEDEPALAALAPVFRPPSALPFRAPHFVRDHLPPSTAPTLRTTLDWQLQTLLEQRIRAHVARNRRDGIHNAAALLLDHRSMEVLALVGSANFFANSIDGQVNGVRARRSPGSTLKPLLYALALDAGLIHPMTLLADAPRRYAGYAPENFDRGFLGPVFARDALIHSRNVPAVSILAEVGVPRFRDWLAEAGVSPLRPARELGLALALGAGETTMEELVRLYALLANHGVWRELRTTLDAPHAADRRLLSGGRRLLSGGRRLLSGGRRLLSGGRRLLSGGRRLLSGGRRLLSGEASFLVLDMLEDVPRSDDAPLRRRQQAPVAWKTGTSFGFRDAWSIGVAGPYVLAVWVGNFDATSNPAFVGRTAAAPLFLGIAESLLADIEPSPPRTAAGLNLRRIEVCAPTGDLPGRHCPRTASAWFIPGVSPIKVSTVHRAVRVHVDTGLRSCRADTEGTRQEVYEFWPSDLEAVFRRAGVAIRKPPPWSPECGLDVTASSGQAPRIQSPQPTLIYHAPATLDEYDEYDEYDKDDKDSKDGSILFDAITDADAQRLFWFVNGALVADVKRHERYFWTPRSGRFSVRAVDDLGRGAEVSIRVSSVTSSRS